MVLPVVVIQFSSRSEHIKSFRSDGSNLPHCLSGRLFVSVVGLSGLHSSPFALRASIS